MRLILLLLFLALSLVTRAQSDWIEGGGPNGGNVTDVEYDAATGKWYAIVDYTPYFSTDDGATWTQVNYTGNGNFINDIYISGSNIYFLATFDIYVSTDAGVSFVHKNTDFVLNGTQRMVRLSTGKLVALSQFNSYTSTNNGQTWTAHSGSFNSNYIVADNTDKVFVISSSTGLPLVSTTGGDSFAAAGNSGLTGGTCYSLATNISKSTIYAVNGSAIWSSSNAASSWTSAITSSVITGTIASATTNPSFLIFSADGLQMFFVDNVNHKLYTKTVAGATTTWTTQISSGFVQNGSMALFGAAKNASVLVVGTFPGIYASTNSGLNFTISNSGLYGIRPQTLAAYNGSIFLQTNNSAGLLVSSDQNESWSLVTTSSMPNAVSQVSTNTDVFNAAVTQTMFALVYPTVSTTDVYRTQNGGFTWQNITTPADFEWVSLSDNDRAYGMTSANVFYYSHNNGTNWSAAIPITGLPASYDISGNRVSLASSTRMLIELYNSATTFTNEYYKIDFVPGAGATITSAIATKITNLPFAAFDKIFAKNGKFYQYTDNSNPNQFTYSSNGGSTWTTVSLPANFGDFFVADNGYIFVTDQSTQKVYYSSDNGTTFLVTSLPGSADAFDIRDITLDAAGYGYLTVERGYVHRSKVQLVLPATPTNLAVNASLPNAVALRWDDNATNEDYYQIERSTDAVNFTALNTVNSSQYCDIPASKVIYVDQSAQAGTTYQYRVKAVNTGGSSTAVTVSAVTPSACVTSIPDNRSWTATNVGGTGYATSSPVNPIGVRSVGNGIYEVSDLPMGLISGGPYKDRFVLGCSQTLVLGVNTSKDLRNNGVGSWNGTNQITLKWLECGSVSKTETVTLTLNASDPAPAAPTGVQALVAGTSAVEISWNNSFYEKDYIVEKSTTSPSSGFSQVGTTVISPNNKLTDTGPFVEGSIYYYRVIARNGNTTPLSSTPSIAVSLVFKKPNFIVSATTVSAFVSSTIGSYWADFNNDGLDDLFTVSADITGGGFPGPYIFKNLGNGNFEQRSVTLENSAYVFSSVVDFNSDGNADIATIINNTSTIDLYQGNGDFTFTKLAAGLLGDLANSIQGDINGISWADVDRNGFVDLLVCAQSTTTTPLAPQLFLRSAGGGYSKVTGGELANYTEDPSQAFWADYDNDSNPDVLIVDGDATSIFKGDGTGSFTIVASPGFDVDGATSAAWGDYTGDGNIDLFVAHTVNTLYKNNGNGTFTKEGGTSVSETAYVASPFWGDFNNDGLLDLIAPQFLSGSTRIYINTTVGSTTSFQRIVTEVMSNNQGLHEGAAAADYDGDGFLDVSMASLGFAFPDPIKPLPFNLFKNINTTGGWSEVTLRGNPSNAQAVGAQIFLQAGTKTYLREVQAPSTLLSQNSPTQHFGIGNAASINSITVYWPSGTTQVYNNPPKNTKLTIVEDTAGPVVTLLSPASGATGVGVSSTIEITFDEATTAVAGKNMYITRVSDGGLFSTINIATGVKTGNKYTFTLGSQMQQITQYAITFDAGAFKDIYGNTFTGLASAWQFTTVQGPQVTALSPLNNAVNVPSNTTISITFNVPTTRVAGKFLKIYRTSDLATVIYSQEATTAATNANQQVFTLATNLPTETALTVIIEAGAFKDAGNAVAAGGQWAFTTMPGPKVTLFSPSDESTGIAANTTLALTFDKTVTAESGKKVKLFKGSDPTAVYDVDVTTGVFSGNKITFTVSPKLVAQTNYTATVDAFAFRDATGNLFNGVTNTEWNFRTDSGPAVTTVSPASGATNVSTTASIEITFNRAISAAVAGKHLQVFDGSTSVYNVDVSATGTISGSKYTATAPSSQWPAGKVLTIVLDAGAFVDAGGNDSDGIASGTNSFSTEVGPAITSRKPAVGEVGVAPNASIEITFDKNITAVAGKKIEIKDGSSVVASSNVSTTGTIAGTKYTYPAPALGWGIDKLLTVTLDGGAFVDIGSKPSAAITGTEWTFRTINTVDTAPPEISFTSIATTDKQNLLTSFTASVNDNVAVASTKMFIRGIGGSGFTPVDGAPGSGTTYTYTPTSSPFDGIGAQYYFTAADAANNTVRSPASGYYQTYVKYNTATSAIPSGLIGATWRVVSIPFQLGSNNAVSSVFEELTSRTYKKDWRMLILSENPIRWVDYNSEGFTNIDRGVGYMLNVKTAPTISIGSDLTAPDNRRDKLFNITLKAGWNMIGNPYLVNINWTDVVQFNGLTGTAAVFKKFNGTDYVDNGLVAPFEGGFVNVASQIEVTIPFAGQISNGGREKDVVFNDGDWLLPITLHQNGLENTFGGVGMHHESTSAFDKLDNFNGPGFIEFIEMNFSHPNDFPRKFSRDVVSVRDEYSWEFEVDASNDGTARMTWDPQLNLASDKEVYLWDPAASVAINMLETGSYEFNPRVSRKFKIYFGKDARNRIMPERSLLGDPFPNPTGGISYIPYSLPEGNPQYGVKIEVFDIMGRRVATIEDGELAPGLYRTAWTPQDANSNGLYTVRMTVVTGASSEVYSGKILLNK